MKTENVYTKKLEQETKEFPIIDHPKPYRFPETPNLQEGTIIHFTRTFPLSRGESISFFTLLKTIGKLHYVFSLNETPDKTMGCLNFKTEEYEYATTNLNKKERETLFVALSTFLDSISKKYPDKITEIWVTPANASYSSKEIEACIDRILSSPNNTLTREQITSRYKGFEVFDLYGEITGKDFLPVHYNKKSRAAGRSRLFKIMIRKYFPNWEIVEKDFFPDGDFFLKQEDKNAELKTS